MNSELHYEETTVAELIERTNRNGYTGTVLVSFPFNDYLTRSEVRDWSGNIVRAGKVKTHSPSRHLKLLTDKLGAFVRFDGRKWDITGVKAIVMTREDGSTYRHLSVTTINARS